MFGWVVQRLAVALSDDFDAIQQQIEIFVKTAINPVGLLEPCGVKVAYFPTFNLRHYYLPYLPGVTFSIMSPSASATASVTSSAIALNRLL